MNHNLFCIRQNCNVKYRNGRADQIKITDESIIILKDLSKEQVFIKPMGDISLVEYTVLDKQLTQSHMMPEQIDLFMLSKIAESGYASKEECR